jgi:hypothetical protein
MKIGILTFHRALNYGAVLQLYALNTYLKSLGYNVYVIDYYNKYVYDNYKLLNFKKIICKNPFRLIKRLLESIIEIPAKKKKKQIYNNFLFKNFQFIEYKQIDTLDCIIVGSDQVWNPKISGGFLNPYFGYGIPENVKLLSYAASTELTTMTLNNHHKYLERLEQFNNICVRENLFAEYLASFLQKNIQVCLDPTLLVSHDIWKKIATPVIEENYVLVYQARPNKETLIFAERIATQLKSQIIILTSNVSSIDKRYIIKETAKPEDFVGYFMKARCVIALSFHAVAFSLISKVPFYAIKLNDGWDMRVKSILKEFNLLSRFVNVNDKVKFTNIAYNLIEEKLNIKRIESEKYIKYILSKV